MNRTKSKPPKLTVPGDSYVVTVDGESYYPHAEETVTFRRRGSVEATLASLRLSGIASLTAAEMGEALNDDGVLGSVLRLLSENIEGWTWTDDSGTPLPDPTPEVLRGLDFSELVWLIGAQMGGNASQSEEAVKND